MSEREESTREADERRRQLDESMVARFIKELRENQAKAAARKLSAQK